MKIGIIGNGFVGKATASLQSDNIQVMIYDIDPLKCVPQYINLSDTLKNADIIFICLPTPYSMETKKSHFGILDSVLDDIINIDPKYLNNVVIRSTVSPDYCKKWNVAHMPEFLTEKNPLETFKNTNTWVVGVDNENITLIENIKKLLTIGKTNDRIISDNILLCSTIESALIKLGRNTFLSTKVSFFNEMYDIAQLYDANYDNIRMGICDDNRIGYSHSMVPGHDGFRGFGGICFPKDLWNLIFSALDLGYDPLLLNAVEKRNNLVRPIDAHSIDIIHGRSVVYDKKIEI